MKRTKKFIAAILAIAMLMTIMPAAFMAAGVDDGIEFSKISQVNDDNSVDITMEAYTTGTVINTSTTIPTDIILVLDVSGSMDAAAEHSTGYVEAVGKHYTYFAGFLDWSRDAYGFRDGNYGDTFTYYKKNSDSSYTELRYAGRDDNEFEYYTDGEEYYYPVLESGTPTNRDNNYQVIQMWRNMSHMEILKQGADAFIASTAEKNAAISDASDKHRISIIKFADDSYYGYNNNGRLGEISDPDDAVVGDNKSGSTNYTQVVKDFTVVDSAGKEALTAAMNALTAGGATAVDFGLQLAVAQFGKRGEEAVDRNEVVIVFTDGAPTHSSSYSDSVAGSAINLANSLKAAGVIVYSIGGANGADSSILGDDSNRFMHYISNNFPEAAYRGGSITAGTGSIGDGYYMTPDDDKKLDEIFIDIMDSINYPTVLMGSSAAVIDTVSPYFTIPDGVNSVTLQTADKTADGWAEPVAAAGVTAEVNGQSLYVSGFDFDANHITEVPRGDNDDFYGRKLIITVHIIPNYDEIDRDTEDFEDGLISTNNGLAEVVNSDGIAVDTQESPSVLARKVTYIIDGQVTKTLYRLKGASVTVDADPSREGYTFSGWSETGTFTMPDEDVEIRGSFTPKPYKVRYLFDGIAPIGAVLPDDESYDYSSVVSVEEEPDIDGYEFSGWYTDDVSVSDGKFTMPAHEVIFYGRFTPTIANYTVRYYFENLEDDGYTEDEDLSYTGEGTTGTIARAELKTVEGFTLNRAPGISTISGAILPNGGLELKLYYQRNRHNVNYSYIGDTAPEGANPSVDDLKNHNQTEVKYGTEITVIADPTLPELSPWEFTEWTADNAEFTVSDNVKSFEMPDADVNIKGSFRLLDDESYKIEHYLQNSDGQTYTHQTANDVTAYGTPNTKAFVRTDYVYEFSGYEYDPELSVNMHNLQEYNEVDGRLEQDIAADGSTVFKLYYTRKEYPVTYEYVNRPVDDMPTLPDEESHIFGSQVSVADEADFAIEGYIFSGWDTEDATIEGISPNKSFEMPTKPVVIRGRYSPAVVEWKEEHYLQNIDGTDYVLDATPTGRIIHNDTTGSQITVNAGHYPGFDLNEEETNEVNSENGIDAVDNNAITVTVLADGSLVVRFYYDRVAHNVTYQLEGMLPEAVNAKRSDYETTTPVLFEKDVALTVIPEEEHIGYTFSGWQTEDVQIDGTGFKMPANDVLLRGSFTALDGIAYKIEHYLQKLNADGTAVSGTNKDTDYELQTEDTYNGTGRSGQLINIIPKAYEGFAARTDNPISANIKGDGSLVVKLYYDRHLFNVEYHYYGEQPIGAPEIPASYNKENVPYGAKLAVEEKLEFEGHEFLGWNSPHVTVDANGEYTVLNAPNPNMAVMFYGMFIDKHDVSYELNGGTAPEGVDYSTVTVNHGTVVTVKQAPTMSGYTFSGWTDGTQVYQPEDDITVTNDIILTATWIRNTTPIVQGDVKYIVEHYKENEDGSYPEEPTEAEIFSARIGDNVTAVAKEYDEYCLNTLTSVMTGTTKEIKAIEDILVLKLYYDIDAVGGGENHDEPDDVPDKYQKKITFRIVNGKWSDKTNDDIIHYVVLMTEGKWDKDGEATLTAPTGMEANAGYGLGKWDVEPPEKVSGTEPATYTYSYEKMSGGDGGGGGGVTTYTLTYESNGGTKISKETYTYGKVVELTKKPERDGYIFDGWHSDAELTADVSEVKMTKNITVYAAWIKDNGNAGNGHSTPDTLNSEDHFAYVVGYPDGTVRPDNNITRAEVTSIFFRLLKEQVRDENLTSQNGFADISAADWYNKAISTMAKLGIVKGRTDDAFDPEVNITRAEFAAICARFDESEFEIVDNFVDVEGHWAEDEIHEAAAHGWIRGYEMDTFKPDQFITRAEAMTMINRVLNRIPENVDDLLDDMIIWPDNSDESAWYYIAVQEATNGHKFDMKNKIYEKWTALTEVEDWTQYE